MPKDRIVGKAPWWRRHRVLAIALAIVVATGLAFGGDYVFGLVTAPALACGSGLATNAPETACVGIDLTSGPLTRNEPARMGELERILAASNNAVTGDYVSIVLLLDLTPVKGVDTADYPDLYPNIEGAIAAAWRANHTAAFQGGNSPKVKVFLANLGSGNAAWSEAANAIAANGPANRVTAVIGLGQSTDATRRATKKLTAAGYPVIGATVTGDDMNLDPDTRQVMPGFFRVSPTNSDTVAAAARMITGIEPDRKKVTVVNDTVPGDDYTQTLSAAAGADLPGAYGRFFRSPGSLPQGIQRDQELEKQFGSLNSIICGTNPTTVFFAGRGADLPAFLQSWSETYPATCAGRPLTVVTGDDGDLLIFSHSAQQVVGTGQVRALFTLLASPDEWGPCDGAANRVERANFDQFQAAFTGGPDPCTNQLVIQSDNAARLSFTVADLRSGQAMLTHDAAAVAITVARRAVGKDPNSDLVVRDPSTQIGLLEAMQCGNAVHGASGTIAFGPGPNGFGNPIGKPIPIVELHKDGTTATIDLVSGGPSPTSGC